MIFNNRKIFFERSKCLTKWKKLCILFLTLALMFIVYLFPLKPRGMPQSFAYFGVWQKSGVCTESKLSAENFLTTIRNDDFDIQLFVHDPKKDRISEIIYGSSFLNQIPTAKLVKSFYDVYTDIDYVIDIGAHVGLISILSAMMGKHVVSIDGERENLKLLCDSLSQTNLNKQVVIIDSVVGVSNKPVTWMTQTNGNYSGSYVDADDSDWILVGPDTGWKIEPRSSVMIDSILGILPNVRNKNVFMNVDVNGYENMVLLGAQLFMKKTHVRGLLINFKDHKRKTSGLEIVQIAEKFDLHPFDYIDNTLVNLEQQEITEWPDIVMWL